MVKIVYRHQIDTPVWDSFIERSLQRNIYALSWFLDLMPKAWGAVIKLDSTMQYVAVLPFQIRSKYGIKIIHQQPETKELGVYSLVEVNPNELLNVLRNEFRYIARYYLNVENGVKFFFEFKYKTTHHLPLAESYDEIFRRYSQNCKRNLKNARAEKQRVVESDDIDVLLDIFKENVAHKIYGLKDYQYDLVRAIYIETKNRNIAFLLNTVSERGEVYSAALFIRSFNRLVYFFRLQQNRGEKAALRRCFLTMLLKNLHKQISR